MRKRILIAEDDLESRNILTTLVTMQGYDVVAVSDGIELLRISAEERFDLIITDLMMANLNGVSAAKIIKMQGNTVPVIALTGLSTDEIFPVQDSFTRIFNKPCNFVVMIDYIESLIGK